MTDTTYPREEVETAFHAFIAAGDSGDWSAWADLHTVDCEWVEHHFGTIVGRDAIRSKIIELMGPVPMMQFPVEWHMIDGNRVVFLPWQVLPDPAGGDAVYRFACITILEYAGNGEWSRQEDIYNPAEGEAVVMDWISHGGQIAGDPNAIGLDV